MWGKLGDFKIRVMMKWDKDGYSPWLYDTLFEEYFIRRQWTEANSFLFNFSFTQDSFTEHIVLR